jgi:uncharacterized membrane protein
VVLRGLVGVPAIVLTSARYVYGGLLLTMVWLAAEGAAALPPSATLWSLTPLLVLQGLVLSYGGTLMWYLAIARIDLARATAIVVPSVPLLSLVASFVLLGEVATATQWAGMGLTAAGILVFVTDRKGVTGDQGRADVGRLPRTSARQHVSTSARQHISTSAHQHSPGHWSPVTPFRRTSACKSNPSASRYPTAFSSICASAWRGRGFRTRCRTRGGATGRSSAICAS